MSTFKALLLAQVVAAVILLVAAYLLTRVAEVHTSLVGSIFYGVMLYALPTLYMDLQQQKLRIQPPQAFVQGFYRASMGKFVLTLCGFALVFAQGSVQHAEAIFIAYLAMWLAHTTTYLVIERTRS